MPRHEGSKADRVVALLVENPNLSYSEIAQKVPTTKRYVQDVVDEERRKGRSLPARKPGRKPKPVIEQAPPPQPEPSEAPATPPAEAESPFEVVRMKHEEEKAQPTTTGPEWRCGSCGTEGNGPAQYCPGCGGKFQ